MDRVKSMATNIRFFFKFEINGTQTLRIMKIHGSKTLDKCLMERIFIMHIVYSQKETKRNRKKNENNTVIYHSLRYHPLRLCEYKINFKKKARKETKNIHHRYKTTLLFYECIRQFTHDCLSTSLRFIFSCIRRTITAFREIRYGISHFSERFVYVFIHCDRK